MMSGRRLREKEQLAGEDERVAWDSSFDRTRDIMTNIGLAFDFYRQPEVIAAFRHANERIRSVLLVTIKLNEHPKHEDLMTN